MTKTRNRNFFARRHYYDEKKMYILNKCREHTRCDNVKAYKSSQLTNVQFKPMQNSSVRAIV